MNSRKYRVVCRLNALDRRLRESGREGAAWPTMLETLCMEAGSIAEITASADRRYLCDRLDYMLQSHCADDDSAAQARQRLDDVLSNAGIGDLCQPHALARSA